MRLFLVAMLFSGIIFADTLKSLENYALNHSPMILKAKSAIKATFLKRELNRIKQFGEIDLVGSYTHYNIERTLAPLPPSAMKSPTPITASKDIYSVGVNYSVALFTGFAQTRDIEISKLSYALANSKFKLSKEEIIYNIRSLYLSILSLQELLKAQNDYILALKRLLKVVKLEVSLGKKAEIDLIKSQSELEFAKVQKEQILSNIEISKAALGAIVGKRVKRVSPIKISLKKPRYSIASLMAKANSLAKVKIDDIEIAKANKSIQKAKAAKYPQVALNAYYGKNYGADVVTDKWDNKTNWQVGVNVKYNLIDFGKSNKNIELAKLNKIQAQLQKNQNLLNLKKSIIEAVSKIKLAYTQYISDSSQYRLAKKSSKIEEVRYKNDLSTINDLLLAKSKASLAKAKLIESRYNYKKAKFYLDYIMEKGVK